MVGTGYMDECTLIIFDCISVTSMSDLLLNWLNDEIQLSKRISNFEEDFHNGFLFGELLAKYSQQLNFHEFVNKDDKASRIKNFSLLLETFTALKVTYDSNIAMKIIGKQLGVAKKLLYELKTQLEKTNTNTFNKTSSRLNKTLSPLKKIQISKEKFDSVNKEHFSKQLNELHPAQKEIIQDKLLKKFSDFHQTSSLKAMQDEEKEMQTMLHLRSKFYEQQRDNIKKSQEFRKQWESQNIEKWSANMIIRQTQMIKDEHFRQKNYEQKTHNKTMSEVNALKALENDIAAFERKNLNQNADDSDDEPQPQKQSSKLLEKTVVQPSKIREEVRDEKRLSAAQTEKKKHLREKRRRKMIVEQQKRYQVVEITRRERCIISTIQQTSKQQKEIQYEIWRAWQNKNVVVENKNLQNQKIKEKEQVRQINTKFKRDDLLKLYREEHKAEVQAALKQNILLQRTHQVHGRKDSYRECQNIVLQLLDITEDMYNSCQERNSSEMNSHELEAAFIKFIENAHTVEEDNTIRLKHYIEGTNEWGIPIKRPEQEVSTDPKEDNALPNENVNNYYLGNILKSVFEKLLGKSEVEVKDHSDKLIVSIVGLDFGGKKTIGKKAAAKYGFNLINVNNLIEEKLKDFIQFQKKGLQISKETEQLAIECFSGKKVDSSIVINLIKNEVEKHSNSLLIDYPNTYEQALQLCKALGNIQPHDILTKDKLTKKIEQYSRLVRSTDAKIVKRQVRECGVDFVWWIDTTVENSLDRMLGRRWVDGEQVHINDDIEPYDLIQKEKSAALVMRNHFKLKNKDKIAEWFELFGTQFGSSEVISKKCWQVLDGNNQLEAVEANVLSKIQEVLAIKEKQKKWQKQKEELDKKKQTELEQLQKKKREKKDKCVASNPEQIKQQLSVALSKSDLSKDFLEQIADIWNKIEATTINSLNKAFQGLHQQEQNRRKYLSQIKKSFISLLMREDHKFFLIKDFQRSYNKFIAQNEDMLAYDYTKQELHQRVEDLQNNLLEVVEEKKEDAIAERGGVMGSGWMQSQMEYIQELLFVIVQAELNRYAASEKIITDYYAKRFMANTKAYEPLAPDINSQALSGLEIFKDGNCIKLDKLITEALRILNREEEVSDDKNKKGGKGAPPKKDDKKAAKKGGKEEVEENKEPTAEQIELKKAINTEKAILRQRFNRIKTVGALKLKATYQSVQKLYADLEDLYIYTHKTESKAVLGLTKIFRKSIEQQKKIEWEVQIQHVEVKQTELVRNYEKEKPIIKPAQQTLTKDHFTLSNIKEIIKLLRQQSEGARISTKKLLILFKRILSNQQLKKLLPQTWKTLTLAQIQSFVMLLASKSKAYIDLKTLFLFFILAGYPLPTPEQFEQYTLSVTNYSSLKETTVEKFINTAAWFDLPADEYINTRPFDRNIHIKQLLFQTFKSAEEDSLQIGSFLAALRLSEFEGKKQQQEGWSYFDFAFK